jgi:hypothetical protein
MGRIYTPVSAPVHAPEDGPVREVARGLLPGPRHLYFATTMTRSVTVAPEVIVRPPLKSVGR